MPIPDDYLGTHTVKKSTSRQDGEKLLATGWVKMTNVAKQESITIKL